MTTTAAGALDARGTSTATPQKSKPAFGILTAISTSHMVNDMMQSLILAMCPILKGEFSLSFGQIGLISLTYATRHIAVDGRKQLTIVAPYLPLLGIVAVLLPKGIHRA